MESISHGFLQVLGILDSKQVDILVYILENTEPANNTFVGTYARIQKETGISQMTISRVLKKLQDANFLKKIQNGVWQVSEQIMMKGSEHKKQLLINYYREEEKQITAPINEEEPEPELEEDITSEKKSAAKYAEPKKNRNETQKMEYLSWVALTGKNKRGHKSMYKTTYWSK